MAAKNKYVLVVTGIFALLCAAPLYAQAQKSLTNDDVIAMVNKKLPESVIVSAIQAGPANFDTSTNELIRLNTAGVTEKELNAILATSTKTAAPSSGAGANAAATDLMPPSTSRMPRVAVTQGGSTQELQLEKTQLAQTKNKPSSMKALASDTSVGQAMAAGVNTATYGAASHINSGVGSFGVQQAGSVVTSMMSRRTATVTYVWGVPGPASGNILQTTRPIFSIDFSRAFGINPDDYQPAIVKLTPAQNTCRVVGATEGKEDVRSSPAVDWQVYSHFLEERVVASHQKLSSGKYKLVAGGELVPGEYAVVLRPVSSDKKFSGGDVSRAQGDGLIFDAIWTFQISVDAQ